MVMGGGTGQLLGSARVNGATANNPLNHIARISEGDSLAEGSFPASTCYAGKSPLAG
jgi:hypothetical protein